MQVRESDQLSLPVRQVASLDMVLERAPCPPLCGGGCSSGEEAVGVVVGRAGMVSV